MSVTHATKPAVMARHINTDLIDRLVEVPLTTAEAGQVLAHYLPLVVDNSPADAHKNWYLVARLHCGVLVGKFLDPALFNEAAWIGEEIRARRVGADGDCTYEDWTMDQLHEELATTIDQLLGGTK